jgi:hypothetical protein
MAWREPMWSDLDPRRVTGVPEGQPLLTPNEFFEFHEYLPADDELNASGVGPAPAGAVDPYYCIRVPSLRTVRSESARFVRKCATDMPTSVPELSRSTLCVHTLTPFRSSLG